MESDPRTWLTEVQERYAESRKDASHVVMFDNMDAALADNPTMSAALVAVLDLQPRIAGSDSEPGGNGDMWVQGYRDGLEAARTAIEKHLPKEDA